MLNKISTMEKISETKEGNVFFMDLTPIEAECIIYAIHGNNPLQIAGLLDDLTPKAVRAHLRTVVRKCGAISIRPSSAH